MDIKDFSEEQLVNSLNDGNDAAITEIYNRYWRKLLAIAYNHTKDKISAEEIVQEVLINLWDRRGQLKINSLNNYLAVAVKYAVMHSIQRQQRRDSIAFAIYDSQTQDQTEQDIYARFLHEYINGVVDKLPEKCRIVFKCSRQDGKNTSEIAKELSIAEKTVEAHLTKAIKSIRFSLKSLGIITFFSLLLAFL